MVQQLLVANGLRQGEYSPPALNSPAIKPVKESGLNFTQKDLEDALRLDQLYTQCRDQVLNGSHPVPRETAIRLAAIQCFIERGPYRDGEERSVYSHNLLPKEYARAREHEKNIVQEYCDLLCEDERVAKKLYCQLCQSLPTYGVTFFLVKEPKERRLVQRLFGVCKDCVMNVDPKTKMVLKSWPLEQLRRWTASPTTFNIDFGDYVDGYYSVQTPEGEKIKKLIGDYVDIILKRSQYMDPMGIEGDEGCIILEDMVWPGQMLPTSLSRIESPTNGDFSSAPSPPSYAQLEEEPTPYGLHTVITTQEFCYAPRGGESQRSPRQVQLPFTIEPAPTTPFQGPIAGEPQLSPRQVQLPFTNEPPPITNQLLLREKKDLPRVRPFSYPPAPQPNLRATALAHHTHYFSNGQILFELLKNDAYRGHRGFQRQLAASRRRVGGDAAAAVANESEDGQVAVKMFPTEDMSSEKRFKGVVGGFPSGIQLPRRRASRGQEEVPAEAALESGRGLIGMDRTPLVTSPAHVVEVAQQPITADREQMSSPAPPSSSRVPAIEVPNEQLVEEARLSLDQPPQLPAELSAISAEQLNYIVGVGKDSVREQLSMLVATAGQLVQLSGSSTRDHAAISDSVHSVTASLIEMVTCVRELSALVPSSQPVLQQHANTVCESVAKLIKRLDEEDSKRSTLLAAASQLGDHAALLCVGLESMAEEGAAEGPGKDLESHFDLLNDRIQQVATSAANLVLQAKTIQIADCVQKQRVTLTSTSLANSAGELLALVRVLSPILHQPAYRLKVEEQAQQVADAIHSMIRSIPAPVPPTIDSSARLMHQAIHQLLKHVKNL